MDSKKEIQHVYLVGAKSLGAYGGYETFVYKLTEYHQNGMNKEYPMSKGLWTSSALGVAAYADEIKLFIDAGQFSGNTGFVCYKNHRAVLAKYTKFLKKYFAVVIFSIVCISLYTIIRYPLNPLITTYGFASYYLYSFLAIPILYIFSVENGYESLFELFNFIAVVMYIITIIQGIAYIKTGSLLFNASSDSISGGMIRDGKVRFNSGALAFLMIIYNFYKLYNYRNIRVYRHYGGSPQSALYRQAEGQPHNKGTYP